MLTVKNVEYKINDEESKRINIIKFLSIIMVVFIHSYLDVINFSDGNVSVGVPTWLGVFQDILSQGIARSAVPMFFLISAILLFKRKQEYKSLLKGKFVRLVVPFVFWNAIWVVIFFLFQQIEATKPYFSNPDNIITTFGITDWLNVFGISLTEDPFLYPLWFMRDLMVMYLLYVPLYGIISRFPRFSLVAGLILIFIPFNFPYDEALTFFILGGSIVSLDWRMTAIDKIKLWALVPIYAVVLVLDFLFPVYAVHRIMILIGCVFYIRISKTILDSTRLYELLKKIIPYTFIIYVGHEFALFSVKKLYSRFIPTNDFTLFFQYFFLAIIIIACCILVGFILKKYFNPIYRFVTGE